MTESEIVKMCVVLVPVAWTMLIAVIGGIIEMVSDHIHKHDLDELKRTFLEDMDRGD